MANAEISILGLYMWDNTVLDGLIPPVGIDKADLHNELLAELAELEVLYPNPDIMKAAIEVWSRTRRAAWAKMFTALDAEYNPLHNYDRLEEWVDNSKGTNSRESSGSHNTTDSGSGTSSGESSTTTQNYHQNTDIESVAAFDSATMQGKSNHTIDGNDSSTVTGTESGETSSRVSSIGTTTGTESGTENQESTHSGKISGNIGVTTSQEMLAAEVDLRTKYSMYDIIIGEFKRRFCILVY